MFSIFLLDTSSLSLILTLNCFCADLNNSLSSSLKALFFSCWGALSGPEFVAGEAPHCSGGNGVHIEAEHWLCSCGVYRWWTGDWVLVGTGALLCPMVWEQSSLLKCGTLWSIVSCPSLIHPTTAELSEYFCSRQHEMEMMVDFKRARIKSVWTKLNWVEETWTTVFV